MALFTNQAALTGKRICMLLSVDRTAISIPNASLRHEARVSVRFVAEIRRRDTRTSVRARPNKS